MGTPRETRLPTQPLDLTTSVVAIALRAQVRTFELRPDVVILDVGMPELAVIREHDDRLQIYLSNHQFVSNDFIG